MADVTFETLAEFCQGETIKMAVQRVDDILLVFASGKAMRLDVSYDTMRIRELCTVSAAIGRLKQTATAGTVAQEILADLEAAGVNLEVPKEDE